MFRKFFIFLFLSILFLPNIALAVDVLPEFNPICWKKEDCVVGRTKFLGDADMATLESGWVQEGDCVGEWGKCLPSGTTKAEISFGGKTEFSDIGDYILTVYKYAVSIVSILAVIVIIVSGVQWTVSGGNSEAIGSAKKKIMGAVVGLFIAFMSYAILNTINPALVNLRLPQVWMLRPMSMMTQYCSQLSNFENKKFAEAGPAGQSSYTQVASASDFKYPRDAADGLQCGKAYFVESGGNSTCLGDSCANGNICINQANEENAQNYQCVNAMLGGKISTLVDNTGSDNIIDCIKLIAVCGNGDLEEVGQTPNCSDATAGLSGAILSVGALGFSDVKNGYYYFPRVSRDRLVAKCVGKDGLMGLYLGAEVDDHDVVLGSSVSTAGEDDWFSIGQTARNSRSCDVNLSKVIYKLNFDQDSRCAANECTCAGMSYDPYLASYIGNSAFLNHFIWPEDLENNYICDINITRAEFPSANNRTYTVPADTLTRYLYYINPLNIAPLVRDSMDDTTDCFENQNIISSEE